MRSWATATACGGGATITSAASRSRAAAGGFSNSVVTTAHVRGEAVEGRRVVVRRDEVLVGDATGRGGRVGVEDDGAVTHRAGGDDGVPAELAAAEHADRRRRDDRRHVAVGGNVEDAAWAWRSAR